MIPWAVYDGRWARGPTVPLILLVIVGGAAVCAILPATVGWITLYRKKDRRAGLINTVWSAAILTLIAVFAALKH